MPTAPRLGGGGLIFCIVPPPKGTVKMAAGSRAVRSCRFGGGSPADW